MKFLSFFITSIVFLALVPLAGQAATPTALFLNPASGNFLVGSTFDLSIVLDTKGSAVNTVEIELLFPPDKIQVATPSVGQSVIQLWPAPPTFSNREGRIYFVGGIPSPGLVTSQGVILTLSFRVVGPGEAAIRFGDKTSILANDGQGTDIIGTKSPAFLRFSVPPPQGPAISSPTHPDAERWYRDPNPTLVWERSKFADGYSFNLDQDPAGFPDTTIDSQETTAGFQDLAGGFWYFHLRERAGGVWGGVSHYVLKIDREPPAAFRLNISPAARTTERRPIFRFFSTDALSGLSHFELKQIPLSSEQQSEALFFEVTSPYQAVNLEPGRYQVILRAVDKAGNTQDETVTLDIVGPLTRFINREGLDLVFIFLSWGTVAIITALALLVLLIILFVLWRRHGHHFQRSRPRAQAHKKSS